MTNDDLIKLQGKVTHIDEMGFRVECEGRHEMLARLVGSARRLQSSIAVGDVVTVSVSPRDPSLGFIVSVEA